MSLFGSSPDENGTPAATSKSRISLFDDEPSPAPGSKSSLFDDDDASGGSPWGMPTPQKPSRGELVQNLLPASEVPDSYIDTFDNVLRGGDGAGGKMSAAGVAKVLSASNLSDGDKSRIVSVVTKGGQVADLTRNEFNVLLALIGLAQEDEDVTLDGVDERRKNLPVPHLPSLNTIALPGTTELAAKPPQRPTTPPAAPAMEPIPTPKAQTMRKDSLEFPEADPWGSPAMHKGHHHEESSLKPKTTPRKLSNGVHPHARTTSNFTTADTTTSASDSTGIRPPTSGGWGSYDSNPSVPAFSNPVAPGEPDGGFGGIGGGDDGLEPSIPTRSLGGGRVTSGEVEEHVTVKLLPDKEGVFMFQHHNYQVSSPRRGSKVVRRYSDFVWLLDCLQKRYPFRQLPLLPPKRVGVNGNHLAADTTFIEKRRRGLSRFTNALVRHPVLSQEQLVIMFLTVPTELAVWRKQATISVQEEFAGKPLPPGLEDSLPPTLNDLFETSRTGIRRSAEIYINVCNLTDRLSKRSEGLAADHLRLSLSLQSLTDASQDTYATDPSDVPPLNGGLHATAKHLSNCQSLLEDEAKAWDQGVLEDLKRQRDALVSMRELFDRRDRYDRDNIPALEKRIQSNEAKLVALRSKPEGLVKPGEVEKATEAIIKDKESIVAQHARGVFIKECIRDELIYFQKSQYHVSRWNQDWAQERVKYSEMHADNWRQLNEELESMPLGE